MHLTAGVTSGLMGNVVLGNLKWGMSHHLSPSLCHYTSATRVCFRLAVCALRALCVLVCVCVHFFGVKVVIVFTSYFASRCLVIFIYYIWDDKEIVS